MAKSVVAQVLRPARAILQKQSQPFPENTLLLQKSTIPGPPLPQDHTQDRPLITFGQHIYLYNNIRTNQIVYSLTRHLNNHKSLKQLPFLGKKSRPAHLRKDLWQPFCLASFPNPHAGLAAYRKLREYRRLHETAYDLDIITEKEGPRTGQLMGRIRRGKVLMNQKANSVADLAAVLLQQEQGPSDDRKANAQRRIQRVKKLKMQKGEDKVKKAPLDVEKELQGVDGVKVRWANIADAEYAEKWPTEVVHETLEKHRYTAAFPLPDGEVEEPGQDSVDETTSPSPLPETAPTITASPAAA